MAAARRERSSPVTTLPADWSIEHLEHRRNGRRRRRPADGRRRARCAEGGRNGPGHALEFVATFSGNPYQHSGSGRHCSPAVEPFAFFSTSWTDSQGVSGRIAADRSAVHYLKRRSNPETAHEPRPSVPRAGRTTCRIDWLPSHRSSTTSTRRARGHAQRSRSRPRCGRSPRATSTPSAVPSSSTGCGLSPYTTAGSFISRVLDAFRSRWIGRASRGTRQHPIGPASRLRWDPGRAPVPDNSWSSFIPVSASGALGLHSRYIRYRANLASNDPSRTPRSPTS